MSRVYVEGLTIILSSFSTSASLGRTPPSPSTRRAGDRRIPTRYLRQMLQSVWASAPQRENRDETEDGGALPPAVKMGAIFCLAFFNELLMDTILDKLFMCIKLSSNLQPSSPLLKANSLFAKAIAFFSISLTEA